MLYDTDIGGFIAMTLMQCLFCRVTTIDFSYDIHAVCDPHATDIIATTFMLYDTLILVYDLHAIYDTDIGGFIAMILMLYVNACFAV